MLQFNLRKLLPTMLEMKHIRIPLMPRESSLGFEMIVCLHMTIFTGLQFLHFYRTVWWLPQSFSATGVNFELIDGNLVVFIAAILGRRMPYLILKSTLPWFSLSALRILLTMNMMAWMILPSIRIWMDRFSYLQILYLFCPWVLYASVFGLSIDSLWDIPELDDDDDELHECTNDAFELRDQVENLRNLFNNRLKKVLTLASINTYYSTFVPWCFAQTYIYYDVYWVTQHFVLCWMISFSLLMSRAFSPEFSDSFHKVSGHLGRWIRLRPTHIPSQLWSNEVTFPHGSIVKHQRDLYRAEGNMPTAAEPGNVLHQKFQALFGGSIFAGLMVGYQGFLCILTFIIMLRTTEWYQIISITSLFAACVYTLIRLIRDFLVLWKLYQAEELFFITNR